MLSRARQVKDLVWTLAVYASLSRHMQLLLYVGVMTTFNCVRYKCITRLEIVIDRSGVVYTLYGLWSKSFWPI